MNIISIICFIFVVVGIILAVIGIHRMVTAYKNEDIELERSASIYLIIAKPMIVIPIIVFIVIEIARILM